jgi:hypothetical protein
MKTSLCLLAMLAALAALAAPVARPIGDEVWINHLLPLPKQIKIEGVVSVAASEVAVRASAGATDVELQAVKEIEAALAGGAAAAAPAANPGKAKPKFEIVTGLCNAKGRFEGATLAEAAQLAKKPNSDQAYCIVPTGKAKLIVTALTPKGLYYGALTVAQLVTAGRLVGGSSTATATAGQQDAGAPTAIPLVRVVDWPDLAERGVWGGYAIPDLEWMAAQKFNLIESHATLKLDEAGNGVATFDAELVTRGRLRALKVVPIITHMDQMQGSGMFTRYPQLKGVGPKTQLVPSLQTACWSQPLSVKLLSDWATDLARNPDITDLCIWLSEDPGYCECDQCKGQNQFALEAKACIAAWQKAREVNPKLKLRILLTQGTYKDNDKVLAVIPPEVYVSYYDGGRTYDSSRDPMIYPLLEDYARQGRWLGVSPQITASWRIVCPFSSPQFIHFRMTEFVDDKLSCLCGYATPSMRLWDFNSAAAAEWGWNAHGRDARQMALAWATTRGLSDPAKAADWAMTLGDVSWDVYGSRVPYGAFFGEAGNMIKNRAKPALGKGMYRYFETEEKLAQSLAACEQAGKLAAALNVPAITAETQVVTGYVQMLDQLYRMGNFITRATPPTDAERMSLQRDLLAFAETGDRVKAGLNAWAEACLPGQRVGGRLNDTLDVTDTTVAAVSDSLASFGVRNPLQPYLRRRIGGWQDDDFEAKQRIIKTWEVTAFLQGAGEYRVDLVHEKGWNGISGYSVALATAPAAAGPVAQGATPAALSEVAVDKHTSVIGYTPREPVYVLKLPTYDAKLRYFIVADISGVKSSDKVPERRGCQGLANLWKVRQPGEAIEMPPLLPMSDAEKARYGGPKFGKGGLRVGVLQGGYGAESILKHLQTTAGVDAQPLWLISDKNLQACQALVVTQPRARAAISEATAKMVARFVEQGGGLVATHDAVGYRTCPVILPQIGQGVRHVRVGQWSMAGDHPVAAGFAAGAALSQSYYDAIVLEPGAGATVVGVVEAGKLPAIVCGEAGKGRAVLCGLGLAFAANGDEDCTPTSDEARLLDNMIRWCGRQ